MRKFILYPAAALMIGAAVPALASDSEKLCSEPVTGQMLSVQDITSKATAMGYEVRKVEREGNCFEVYAIGKQGARVEIYMNGATGAVVKIKNKS